MYKRSGGIYGFPSKEMKYSYYCDASLGDYTFPYLLLVNN